MDNYAAKTKAQFSYNRKQVCYLCGITDDEFLALQMDTAKAFAQHYTLNDPEVILSSMLFLSWWCYHWNLIDDRVILRDMYEVKPESRYSWYRQMHQYVFDGGSTHRQQLMKDYQDMQPQFEADLKQHLSV